MLKAKPPEPADWAIFSVKQGVSPSACGGICPHHRINRRSGSIRALKGQPLHVVAGRQHRLREVGTGLTDGADHLAAHLFNPCEYVLDSSARLGDAMIPSLLALRQRLVLLALPLNLAAVPPGFSHASRALDG